ncbi:P3 protein [Wheat yellow striate virus]|uniref:P3 protein n=1 Tax=Wheat yellow striate virus TaxID=2152660 RepID=A0A2R4K2J0_9RHAB|nr:P3 protein [Wheat yellow striate virus]AVV48077.1 P3 protein [Wheat yellow striate virus]
MYSKFTYVSLLYLKTPTEIYSLHSRQPNSEERPKDRKTTSMASEAKNSQKFSFRNTEEEVDLSISKFALFKLKLKQSRVVTMFGNDDKVDPANCYINMTSIKIVTSSVLPESDPRFMVWEMSYKTDEENHKLGQLAWKASYNGSFVIKSTYAMMVVNGDLYTPYTASITTSDGSEIKGVKVNVILNWTPSDVRPSNAKMGGFMSDIYCNNPSNGKTQIPPMVAWYMGKDEQRYCKIINKLATELSSENIYPMMELISSPQTSLNPILNRLISSSLEKGDRDRISQMTKAVGGGMSLNKADISYLKGIIEKKSSSALVTFLMRASTELGVEVYIDG